MKMLLVNEDARKQAVEALNLIASAVGTTLGPGGLPAIIETRSPAGDSFTATTTKDGVSVLRGLQFSDPVSHAVHHFACLASMQTMIDSGDGPQPLYSKVLTPKGFVAMGDVYEGMEVCGTDGTIQTVLGVYEKGVREIYEVQFSDDQRVVECCADHLWTVTDISHKQPQTVTKKTSELAQNYLIPKSAGWDQRRYYTPRTVVDFHENQAEMPLDPYLLGVLLGDGSLSGTGAIEISLGQKKEHVIAKLILPEGFALSTSYIPEKNYFRVKINGKNARGQSMHDIVASIGLLGSKSASKFIPKSYLLSSRESREALLRGLTDTDGHINSRGLLEYSSVSKDLAQDVVDLCRSLGLTVRMDEHARQEGQSYSMNAIWRVTQLAGYKYGNRIDRITPTGRTTAMRCIRVSNPNNLYITDNYIVTHNTTSTALIAAAVAKELISHKALTPQAFARQVLAEADAAIAAIRAEAEVDEKYVECAAMTACNGDAQVTSIVMEALRGVSSFGSIHIEKNPLEKAPYQVKVQSGYHAGRGYNWHDRAAISVSSAAAARDVVTMIKPRVFLYNGHIADQQQIAPVLEKLLEATDGEFNLLIVAHDVDERVGEALWKFNTKRRGAKAFIVKSPVLGEERSGFHHMLDVAAITAATVYDYGSMDEFTVAGLGTCDSAEITEHKTIVHGRAPNHTVPERARQNEDAAKRARSQQDVDMIHTRNAELTEGLMTIVLGGAHAAILQERKDRVEDAVRAAQAARTAGVLPGCGVSYIRAAHLAGSETLARAFRTVHAQILDNFGYLDQGKLYERGTTVSFQDGDLVEGSFLDLKVTDSADTVCSAIKNGVQLGVLCATVGCISLTSNLVEIEGEKRVQEIIKGAL